jgi:phospholipase/lecithinase/hemolysin
MVIFAAGIWSTTALAGFTSITVIGDSTSDGGNSENAVISFYKLWGDPFPQVGSNPKEPYFNYRFSNGYVAVEYMAYFLNLLGKNQFFNYAVGGASTSNIVPILDYLYLQTNATLDPTGLYVIELGQVDLLRNMNTPEVATTNISEGLKSLYSKGARHFLVINSMIMGYAPPYKNASQSEIDGASNISRNFNTLLATKVNALPFKDNITLFDFGQTIRIGQQNPEYGFTKPYDACLVNGVACSNPDEYIFWDTVHLTDRAHSSIGFVLYTTMAPKAP